MQSDIIQGVVIDSNKNDYLPEERNGKPNIEYGVWSSNIRYFLERLCIRKEIEIN